MLNEKQLTDLTTLAVERMRSAVTSVTQLMDNHDQAAAILTACALDLMNGAAEFLQADGRTDPSKAMKLVLVNILKNINDPQLKRLIAEVKQQQEAQR